MYEPNEERVLSLLGPGDRVLDIGGWGRPFNRADFVMDAEPYETRLTSRAQGGPRERFTKATWIQRDLCDHTPYPFADKEIDFVVCSHTLEDIRDPLWVCAEMVRIARRGYVEVPSRLVETCRGVESRHFAGYSHHRWLIDITECTMTFLPKAHCIHERGHSFSPLFLRGVAVEKRFQWLFWEDQFGFREARPWPMEAELEQFVNAHVPCSSWRRLFLV
jgi:hypothetical protein